ncbi:hypothetical protein IWZ00DRAFT_491978 [Phyllosticta capitalensis]
MSEDDRNPTTRLPPKIFPTVKRNRDFANDDEDEQPRAHRPRLEDDDKASMDDAMDIGDGDGSEDGNEDSDDNNGSTYKCKGQERLVSFSPSAHSESDDILNKYLDKFKPSWDDVRLESKIKAIAKESAYKTKSWIEECLYEQALIKDRQIKNRDRQIRHMALRDAGGDRDWSEMKEVAESFEKQVREQEELVATLNRVVGSQALAIKEKDDKIRKLGEEVAALRERLRGAQGLPIRGHPAHK